MRILFTSVGRRVELMQAYRAAAQELGIELMIYGTDITENAPALQYCDSTQIVCRIREPQYIPQLLAICEKEKIDALIPTIDTDLLLLSQNKEKFTAIGTTVLIAAEEKVAVCRDKRFTADYFIRCGLKSPLPVDDYTQYEGGFPAFIKPKDGSSSINAFRANNAEELKTYAAKIEDYIIQPFIEGTEYTIDAFCDFNGNPIFITPRERVAVRSGEVLQTRIAQDDIMIAECKQLLADFRPAGAITVQLIQQHGTGDNYYIEINPRYGGGAPLSMKAGANSAIACLRLIAGEQVGYQEKAAQDNAVYSRFDQSICVSRRCGIQEVSAFSEIASAVEGRKGVVFDLDDTLYSEKAYVRSGYQKIAAYLGDASYADKLWAYFEAGKPAVDALLAELGMTEKKAECLAVYREQTPDISLYAGAAALLADLKAKGVKVGIVTDGRVSGQEQKIAALHLEEMVDEIVITDSLGGAAFRKPCDIAFRIMQKRLGLPYGDMVYVGDNMTKDFIAPQQLGMHSVYFKNPDGLYSAE